MSAASVDTRLDPGDVPVVVRRPPAEPPPSDRHSGKTLTGADANRQKRNHKTVRAVQPNTRRQNG